MAIYRLSADIVRRSAGRTVTAAAAYRAGELILDNRTGLAFDYRRRRGVRDTAILAPENAPAWMRERVRLWNGVEETEKRKDAQLARDIELALPHELTHAARHDLVHGFVRAAFVDHGMVADIALHAPDGDERNHHAHILLTLRVIEGESFGPKMRAWNDTARLEQWRALWAEHINRALARAGEGGRVDHRSLEAQGVDRLPQIHLGRAVIEMQRRGIATGRAELAQEIGAMNAALAPPDALAGFAAAHRKTVERRKAVTLPELPRRPQSASTAPQIAPLRAYRRIPVLLKAFRKAAAKRLRRIRVIRLSREAWGAPDAHLQTTLNLFDQLDSNVPSGASNNSRADCRHYRVSENSISLGM